MEIQAILSIQASPREGTRSCPIGIRSGVFAMLKNILELPFTGLVIYDKTGIHVSIFV